MELQVLDNTFKTIAIIDEFTSLIWSDRHDEAGDFELVLPMNVALLDILKEDYYLIQEEVDGRIGYRADDEDAKRSYKAMIIESLDVTTHVEDGKCLKVVGHSLEQILDRRIILNKLKFERDNSGVLPNLQNGIKKILEDNVIAPAIAARKIDNFIFKESTDPKVTELTFEAEYMGNDIYSVISTLCKENKLGFQITLSEHNQFIFELYAGVDRSYEQFDNPYVVFSPDNDNLFNSSYYKSKSAFKNVAVIAGPEPEEDSDDPWEIITITNGECMGMDRREVFADGSDISTKEDNEDISVERYRAKLKQRGYDALIEYTEIEAFDGEVEATIMYKYGEDFFIGDIVQLVDVYGNEGTAYISEFITSQDKAGISRYPTFITIQKGVYDYE